MTEQRLEALPDNFAHSDFIFKGDDLQKLSVIEALPHLLQTDYNATISRIIPKIQQELPNSSSEFHIAASNIFKLLFDMKLSINLLRPVLQGIESKDPIIANAWVGTLLAVTDILILDSILSEVLPFALKLTQINRNVFYRASSCKILGKIAIHPKITQFEVKKDILPAVQSLCQDCLYEVRASMCAELPNIAKGLESDDIVKSSLLPCLVELSSDENMMVRAAAVNSVVCLIPYMNPDTVSSTIIPLVKKLCMQSFTEGDHTFTSVAKCYGPLLNNLTSQLTYDDSHWFFNFYRHLAKKGLTIGKEDLEIETSLALICREQCAYNLPAVTSFVRLQLPQELHLLGLIFSSLAGDPCYLVRKSVASCIQEVVRLLDTDSRLVVQDFVRLLRDEEEEVLDALVPNISETLEILTTAGILSIDNSFQETIEISRALLKCQVEIFKYHNWRRKMTFLQQLECLPNCIPGDFIHQHFTQVVIGLSLEAGARPVKTQAVKTVLYFLRYSNKTNHRKWIRDWMTNKLLGSTSCYIRHIYINMCAEAMQIFSWKYFKEYFYLPLLSLGEDPVSTVRLCMVKLCPDLKRMLILPVDKNLQVKLENMLSKMEVVEKDKDVIALLKCTIQEMHKIHGMTTDLLLAEKKKTDEEEKILQGRAVRDLGNPQRVKSIFSSMHRTSRKDSRSNPVVTLRSASLPKKHFLPTSPNPNEMSFLGQHFYTDAGIVLPEKSDIDDGLCESSTTHLEETISNLNINNHVTHNIDSADETVPTVSVENVDIENMSDEDLKELETSTSNITDDVKVNLQKISKSKSMSKLATEPVKKRNKRYSCILPTQQSNLPIPVAMKRRSLNINPGEVSRIPVSFRAKKTEESPNRSNIEVIDGVTNKIHRKHSSSDTKESTTKLVKQYSNNEFNHKNDTKENVPMNSIKINVIKNKSISPTKISGLPVLTRKQRAESSKT